MSGRNVSLPSSSREADAGTGRALLARELLNLRKQIAAQIHSGPVQELVVGTLLAGAAHDGDAVQGQIQAALRQLRDLCARLNPPSLQDFGLTVTLRAAVRAAQRNFSEWEPLLEFDDDVPMLDAQGAAVAYALYDLIFSALVGAAGAPDAVTRVAVLPAASNGDPDAAVSQGAWMILAWHHTSLATTTGLQDPLALAPHLVAAASGCILRRIDGAQESELHLFVPAAGSAGVESAGQRGEPATQEDDFARMDGQVNRDGDERVARNNG